MKKILLFFVLILNTLLTPAQFTAPGSKIYSEVNGVKLTGIDSLFVFNGINSQSAIIYNGANKDKVKWYTFDNPSTPLILQTPNENYNIEDNTGYIVDIEGVKKYIWVIDYKNYIPVFTSLIPEDKPKEQCDELILTLNHQILPITYKTPQGLTRTLNRNFQLKYTTKEWSDTQKSWTDKEMTVDCVLPTNKITVSEPPLCDTKFKITGDNFATDLGLTPYEVESPLYRAVKVKCHVVSTTSTRVELNENERPEKPDVTTGSAPLDIIFASNANTPVAEFYQWQIFKEKSLLFTRNDQDLRYTFNEAGTFTVKLLVSNSNSCLDSSSVTIKVVESKLEVPGVFTPNGDGINDEFRAVYKSITEFRCWIFNRWQQKVFYWTDPQKGWDGKINGKPASEGAYFYVIEAVGADGVKHNMKGNINLLRGKKN